MPKVNLGEKMAEQSGYSGAESGNLGDWGSEAADAWNATPGREHRVIRTNEDRGTESVPLTEKLRRPVVQKVLGAMLAAGIGIGALSVIVEGFKDGQKIQAQAMSQLDRESVAKEKQDLIARLSSEGVTTADINEVLADPELMSAYEEMRNQGGDIQTFQEKMEAKGIEVGGTNK